jgi:hydrogenase expression/formation protein HypE
MSNTLLPSGKLPAALLREILAMESASAPELLLPPRLGEDAGVIALADGALVVAGDPVTMTGADVGAHAVLVNANDIAVTGVRPRWFLATILLPEGIGEDEIRALYDGMRETLERHDILLVGGHSEITASVRQTVVSGYMMGFAPDGAFVSTADMRAGDVVLQIGAAPVEGAAVLANEATAAAQTLSPALRNAALNALEDPGISVVEAALRAMALGAHAMHDPTEGGLSAGLYEMAEAARLALHLDEEAVLWFAPGTALCAATGADPWGALASGALLAAFPHESAETAQRTLVKEGYAAATIARAAPGAGVHFRNGQALARFARDEVLRVLA